MTVADGERSFPYWLVTRRSGSRADGRVQALTTRATTREEVLPVFGFEGEARMFIYLAALGEAWRVRRTSAGEVISLLYGPCSSVTGVLLDPLPGFTPDVSSASFFGKREFVSFLSERQRTWFSTEKSLWAEHSLATAGREPERPAEAV